MIFIISVELIILQLEVGRSGAEIQQRTMTWNYIIIHIYFCLTQLISRQPSYLTTQMATCTILNIPGQIKVHNLCLSEHCTGG